MTTIPELWLFVRILPTDTNSANINLKTYNTFKHKTSVGNKGNEGVKFHCCITDLLQLLWLWVRYLICMMHREWDLLGYCTTRINLCPYASTYWTCKSFFLHFISPFTITHLFKWLRTSFFLYSYLFYLASAGMLKFLFVRLSLIGQNFVCYCHFVTWNCKMGF